jgi:excisionase family DNA binding protein
MSEPLLTLRQAASLLACHPETLRRRAVAGRIAYVRDGSRLKFKQSALATYISRREVKA